MLFQPAIDHQIPAAASDRVHGYLWDKGRFTTLDVPGAGDTTVTDLNDRDQLIGVYSNDRDLRSPVHGFVLERGRYTSFDAPGAVLWTLPFGINNRGQIVGFMLAPTEADPLAGARGFLLAKGVKGSFTPIDVPGAPRNLVFGLSDRGSLVGVYENTTATPNSQLAGMQPLGPMS